MMVWSWGTWPDVLIDFGAQLYLAWRLATGQVLYTEIAHLKGPLSPYLNALLFRMFGVGLYTLVLGNLVIVGGVLYLLYQVLVEISNRFAATLACLVFIAIFGFGQYVGIGNYNFICPYSHEVTHGFTLSLVAIYYLSKYLKQRHHAALIGAGLATGLVFLTDVHLFVSVVGAMLVALACSIWMEPGSHRRSFSLLGTFIGIATGPPTIAYVLLCFVMPRGEALRAILGQWQLILSPTVMAATFYRQGMGTLGARVNLYRMVIWTGGYLCVFFPVAVLSLLIRQRGIPRAIVVTILCLIMIVVLWSIPINWYGMARPFPLAMVVLIVVSVRQLLNTRASIRLHHRLLLQLAMAVWALALLGKMLLNARVYHYGFTLAVPATLLVVLALVCWLPVFISQQGGDGELFRAVAVTTIGVVVALHLRVVGAWFKSKPFLVSKGADAFLANTRGVVVNEALEEISRHMAPHETLAVLPHGVMLNYLSRRVNPSPYIALDPVALSVFGEGEVLRSFQTRPPDYIALVHIDFSEFGFRFFGRDYGQQIYSWIEAHYENVVLIGTPPLHGEGFGILLLTKRRMPHPSGVRMKAP